MSLFVLLVITLILCSLLLLVQGNEAKAVKLFAVLAIALEVILLLWHRGALDVSFPVPIQLVVPCVTGALGLFGLFKMSERALPLLIFFTSLLQFFMETNIIDSIR